MRAVTIDSDLATLFTFTPRKPPITPRYREGVGSRCTRVAQIQIYGALSLLTPPCPGIRIAYKLSTVGHTLGLAHTTPNLLCPLSLIPIP